MAEADREDRGPSGAQRRHLSPVTTPRLGLVLGGGAARGLAHIGVLEVLEREGLRPAYIVGTSMGGLVGALSASGLRAGEIAHVAQHFSFPRWFVFGQMVEWHSIFPTVGRLLDGVSFERLGTALLLTAVDLQQGEQVVLRHGPVLPAVRATCAIPGVVPPVKLDGRWLVDGGLLNILPVDVAWTQEPDWLVAVNVDGLKVRSMPQLEWRATSLLSKLGGLIPNPATARVSFEVLVRAAEVVLAQQSTLVAAMTSPDILIEPKLGSIGLRDFPRVDEAIAAGRLAAEQALPALHRVLEKPPLVPRNDPAASLRFDPVCRMVISPSRARASVNHRGKDYYFCSLNCRDCFERAPDRYELERGPC